MHHRVEQLLRLFDVCVDIEHDALLPVPGKPGEAVDVVHSLLLL